MYFSFSFLALALVLALVSSVDFEAREELGSWGVEEVELDCKRGVKSRA